MSLNFLLYTQFESTSFDYLQKYSHRDFHKIFSAKNSRMFFTRRYTSLFASPSLECTHKQCQLLEKLKFSGVIDLLQTKVNVLANRPAGTLSSQHNEWKLTRSLGVFWETERTSSQLRTRISTSIYLMNDGLPRLLCKVLS